MNNITFAKPEFFGCSSKAPLKLVTKLSEAVKAHHPSFSVSDDAPDIIPGIPGSIDKVFRCCKDMALFARMALAHCTSDIICNGGKVRAVSLSLELGPDANEDDATTFMSTLGEITKLSGATIGKCHTSFAQHTAATIFVCGERAASCKQIDKSKPAKIYLVGPFGGLGSLYNSAMLGDNSLLDATARDVYLKHVEAASLALSMRGKGCFVKDVSGFGIAGSLEAARLEYEESDRTSIDLYLQTSYELEAKMGSSSECLITPSEEFLHSNWSRPVRQRQFCGPFLIINPDLSLHIQEEVLENVEILEIGQVILR